MADARWNATICLIIEKTPGRLERTMTGRRPGRRLLLGPDGSAREETVSTPQVPPGPHSPAPDDSPTAMSALARRERASAVERARRMVPEGTFAVGAGLAISGITTYGFQILAF